MANCLRVPMALVLGMLFLFSGSAASARPDTRNYTCEGAQAFIASQGGVTMSTGDRTYQRFVHTRSSCLGLQTVRATYAPTKDVPKCRLSTCAMRSTSDGNR